MKILHTADWHLGDRLGRIDRTADLRRAVERVADYCESERVDVLLVAGDLFSERNRADGLRDAVEHLRGVFTPFLRRGGTIVAVTGNHDDEAFCRTLRHALALGGPGPADAPGSVVAPGRVVLADEPNFFRLPGRDGAEVQVVLMPYPAPAAYLATAGQTPRYASREEKHRALRDAYAANLAAIRAHPAFRADVPSVLAAHVHLEGAVLSSPFRLTERESLVIPDDAGDWAYVALGHVHQPQALSGRPHVRYCGSLDRLDLGERGDAKGVVLVEVGPDGLRGRPEVLPLEATPIYDLSLSDPAAELPLLRDRYPDAASALVKYHVTYRAGRDDLDAVLAQVEATFPRWYDRSWSEASEPESRAPAEAPAPRVGVRETVLEYLDAELDGQPGRGAIRALAEAFLAEEDGP